MEVISSPDDNYRIVKSYVDQGALRSSILLELEQDYFDIIKISKRIIINNENAEIEWVDNENFMINNTIQKVNLRK